ncbi:Hypothetical protein, putative [Bodo saltans]|uniref:Uncharacterized protein n=1 Tax=Bodo saltans TaxID=75058 RepID=A0A0S4JKT1_BODSA|nr:Hypothetical protein, putative [Bodo saltans]|eukprot:CUG90535.1 Hypothetical protein, putative [Bodo saltans]
MAPKEKFARNNPAAQALKKGRSFRDLRASESQITAEQLIAQAQELQRLTGTVRDPSKILLSSPTELALYRQNTRKEFEEHVRKSFLDFGGWVRYAAWEEEQGAADCVRSIFERALSHHGEKKEFWRQYAEAEQRIGTADHARKILFRATTCLPQSVELWLKYVALEQSTHSDDHVRQVFQRWMMTRPPAFVWRLAVQFECYRNGSSSSGGASNNNNNNKQEQQHTAKATTAASDNDRVRVLLKDLVMKHNVAGSWAFYAGIELHALHDAERAIEVLQTALRALPGAQNEVSLHLLLAESLNACGDAPAARKTLVDLLEHCTRDATCLPEVRETVFNALASFERSSAATAGGASSSTERAAQESALINAQVRMRYRFMIEQQHQQQSTASGGTVLDAYASLAALEVASSSSSSAAEEVLRNGVATAQPHNDVEVQQHASLAMALARCMSHRAATTSGGDDKQAKTDAKEMLLKQLQAFPHGRLKNPALWTEACRAILACDAPDAIDVVRKVLGQALGACPDDELFRFYVWLEVEFIRGRDSLARAREIYKAWLDRFPLRCATWSNFALFEFQNHEIDRADSIFKMGIQLLSQRAKEAKIISEAFQFYDEVDALWKERLRCSMKRGGSGGEGRDAAAAHTAVVYEELLQASLGQYFGAFDAWRVTAEDAAQKKAAALEQQLQQKNNNNNNNNGNQRSTTDAVDSNDAAAATPEARRLTPPFFFYNGNQRSTTDAVDSNDAAAATPPEARRLTPPPPAAGAEVQPMIRRLAAALSGCIGFERRRDPTNGMEVLRNVFRNVVQTRRGDLQQRIAADTEFQRVMHERQWVELSLSPVFHLWRQMEAEFGTAESLSAVAGVAEPPKKKARLFKTSKA